MTEQEKKNKNQSKARAKRDLEDAISVLIKATNGSD